MFDFIYLFIKNKKEKELFIFICRLQNNERIFKTHTGTFS